jgi:N-acetylmuramoyl-L-alanine amidase
MIRKFFSISYILALALMIMASFSMLTTISYAENQSAVNKIRIGEHADHSRIVIEFSQVTKFRLFTLDNPKRLVIDVPALEFNITPTGDFASQSQRIIRYRSGLYQAGLNRIVIDLKDDVIFKNHFVLFPKEKGQNYRLVIDVIDQSQPYQQYRYASKGFDEILESLNQQQDNIIAPKQQQNKIIVVLDPGHGGTDPGAIDHKGDYEKHITLRMAKILKDAFRNDANYDIRLTREQDIYLPLRKRFDYAEKIGADLFISIHADAAPSKKTRGATIFTLSETASDKEAEALAQRENKADIIAGGDLSGYDDDVARILLDLEQRSTITSSVEFARIVVKHLKKTTKLVRNTHRFAGFAVLKSPSIPSILVELGFLSNPEEARLLKSDKHLRKLATSISKAIREYHPIIIKRRNGA